MTTTTYRPAFSAAPTITVAKMANKFSGRREHTGRVIEINSRSIILTTARLNRISIPMVSAEIVS